MRTTSRKIGDEAFARRLATYWRHAASPGAAVALLPMNTQIDRRQVRPTIRVPALVIHRTGDRNANLEEDRVAGSGINFTERGSHLLKGVPGEWRLFAASYVAIYTRRWSRPPQKQLIMPARRGPAAAQRLVVS